MNTFFIYLSRATWMALLCLYTPVAESAYVVQHVASHAHSVRLALILTDEAPMKYGLSKRKENERKG